MIPHSRPSLDELDFAAVLDVLRHGMIAEGRLATDLEAAFRARFGMAAAVVAPSGSQALCLALRAAGAGKGGEVILPTYVCPEVLSAVDNVGAIPVLVDIEEDFLISEEAVRRAHSRRTRAIVVPFVLGIWRDMSALREIGVPLIEDWAQFMGTAEDSIVTGDFVVFSFHATKVITGGEGGLVLATAPYKEALAAQKHLRETGYKTNNSPLSDMQAGLVLSQLNKVDWLIRRRRELADVYYEQLADLSSIDLRPDLRSNSMHYRFPIHVVDERTSVSTIINQCRQKQVAVRKPVDVLLHRLCPDLDRGAFPTAEKFYSSTFSIPIYPSLTEQQQQTVVAAVRAVLTRCPELGESFGGGS